MKILPKSRKGAFDISLSEIMGAIFGAIIVIALAFVALQFYNLFTSGEKYQATINNFEVLAERVQQMVNDDDFTKSEMLYSIDDDYILVGFNYDDKGDIIHSTCEDEDIKDKAPNKCKGKSCLCLFDDGSGDDFEDASVVKCHSYDHKIVFLGPTTENFPYTGFTGKGSPWSASFPEAKPVPSSFEYLILYGSHCSIYSDFDIKNLEIYKQKEGGTYFFYITLSPETSTVQEKSCRYGAMGNEELKEGESICYTSNAKFTCKDGSISTEACVCRVVDGKAVCI